MNSLLFWGCLRWHVVSLRFVVCGSLPPAVPVADARFVCSRSGRGFAGFGLHIRARSASPAVSFGMVKYLGLLQLSVCFVQRLVGL